MFSPAKTVAFKHAHAVQSTHASLVAAADRRMQPMLKRLTKLLQRAPRAADFALGRLPHHGARTVVVTFSFHNEEPETKEPNEPNEPNEGPKNVSIEIDTRKLSDMNVTMGEEALEQFALFLLNAAHALTLCPLLINDPNFRAVAPTIPKRVQPGAPVGFEPGVGVFYDKNDPATALFLKCEPTPVADLAELTEIAQVTELTEIAEVTDLADEIMRNFPRDAFSTPKKRELTPHESRKLVAELSMAPLRPRVPARRQVTYP
jgi:hypothetical protein